LLESQPVLSGIKPHDLSPKASETFGGSPPFSPTGAETTLGYGPFYSSGSQINQRGLYFALARAENQSFTSGELRSNSFRLKQKVPFWRLRFSP